MDVSPAQESIYSHSLMVHKVSTSWFLGREHQVDTDLLFMDDKKGDLCSYKAIRKVHEVNNIKRKEQLVSAYHNAGWMSPRLMDVITRVVNDFKVCQKVAKSVSKPRVALPKVTSFNEVVILDLKEFGSKYILWVIDSFTRFMQGKLI